MKPKEGRKRVIIEEVEPQIDCGRYPAKRVLGDEVVVTAAIFGDGQTTSLAAFSIGMQKSASGVQSR